MHLRRFSVTLATLMGFGLSAPVAAQQVEQAQASPDARTPKTGELVSEWQLKPRWRLQYDMANIDGPDGLSGLGSFQDVRRARVGVDLAMPHGFSARVETEFTANPIELTDLYLQWSGKNVKVMLGQQKAHFRSMKKTATSTPAFWNALRLSVRLAIHGVRGFPDIM
jgi:hypothetical protein